jgi:hypothetical protein
MVRERLKMIFSNSAFEPIVSVYNMAHVLGIGAILVPYHGGGRIK